MYEGNAVDLQMEKVIAADAILDDETHHCQVFRYDMEANGKEVSAIHGIFCRYFYL